MQRGGGGADQAEGWGTRAVHPSQQWKVIGGFQSMDTENRPEGVRSREGAWRAAPAEEPTARGACQAVFVVG